MLPCQLTEVGTLIDLVLDIIRRFLGRHQNVSSRVGHRQGLRTSDVRDPRPAQAATGQRDQRSRHPVEKLEHVLTYGRRTQMRARVVEPKRKRYLLRAGPLCLADHRGRVGPQPDGEHPAT